MSNQRGMQEVWERAEEFGSKQAYLQAADRQKTRRDTLKKLRSGRHLQMVLAAARRLAQPFTLSDLAVALWRDEPQFFGMKGYPEFPDNHVVHTYMYGERGLVANGFIERVKPGLFRIPEQQPQTVVS